MLLTDNFELANDLFLKSLNLAEKLPKNSLHIKKQIEQNYANILYNQACIKARGLKKNDQIEAINLFKKSIDHHQYNYRSYYNIACCYINIDQLESGIEYLTKTLELYPEHSEANFALSQYHQQNNNTALAEKFLKKSLEGKNSHAATAEYNYGVLEQQRENYAQAIIHYKKSLELHPQSFAAAYNIGSIYHKLKNYQEAVYYYYLASRINPQDQTCQYLLASLTSDPNSNPNSDLPTNLNLNLKSKSVMNKAPQGYIETLFDNYATTFDYELLNNLNYQTPKLLFDLYNKNIYQNSNSRKNHNLNSLNILDLGCGTGLAAEYFKSENYSNIITGVDISQNMLNMAQQKHIYQNLIKSDIEEYLKFNTASSNNQNLFDLIILADVLVYYGELNNLFNLIKKNLAKDGHLLFSIESLQNNSDSYLLTETGRYQHTTNYIYNQCSKNFNIVESLSSSIRSQDQSPVLGMLFLMNNI